MTYAPTGVCSRLMEVELENNIIKKAKITGGCNGNTQGLCRLVEGMDADDAVRRLEGINCGGRGTSCPDQLAKAIKKAQQSA